MAKFSLETDAEHQCALDDLREAIQRTIIMNSGASSLVKTLVRVEGKETGHLSGENAQGENPASAVILRSVQLTYPLSNTANR